MIRVLHVADKLSVGESTIHGVTRLFSWWIPGFDQNQFDIMVCSLRSQDKAGDYLEGLGVKVLYLNKGKFDPLTLFSLVKLLKDEKIDIVHLHGYGAWTFGRIAGAMCRIPIVVHEHMVDKHIPFYQVIVDKFLSLLPVYGIAISESVKDFMTQRRGVKSHRVKVIENGIPLGQFVGFPENDSQVEDVSRWRKKLNIPQTSKVVGTVGRLNEIKGHRYLLEAAQKISETEDNVTFLIVGDGELRGPLEKMARQLGIERQVRFAGHCDDIAPLMSLMDIVVIASLVEGGPITLFEAMASGCAVVSSNTIGLKAIINDGGTGFLIPPMDADLLSEKILLLLVNHDLCQSMAVKAREKVSEYDITNTIRQLETCYKEILDN